MKKIINGRKYDTETATLICKGEYTSNFGYEREELYKKKTGEFFLYGREIIPLSDSDAMTFVEKNGTVEDYEKCFGEVEE